VKLLLVGLDALDIDYFSSSDLPAFKALRESSQWGTLHTEELWSGPNWTTLFTGLTKEHHGVIDNLGRPFNGSEWIGSRPRDYMWDILHEAGLTVGVLNFPACYVARYIGDGSWMIGGWPGPPSAAPARKLPQDFYTDLPDYAERGPLLARRPQGATPGWAIHEVPWQEYLEWAAHNYAVEIDLAQSMPDTDVLMIQCSVLDRAGHMLSTPNKGRKGASDPRYAQALEFANYFLDRCLEQWPAEYTALVSDHGYRGQHHSHFGTWAVRGPDILQCRNNTENLNFCPTVLDALLDSDYSRDGHSVLLQDEPEQAEDRLKGLGYA